MTRFSGHLFEMTATSRCDCCGLTFGYPASVLANGTTPRWCGNLCRAKGKRARQMATQTHPCVACGADANPSTHSHGVEICAACSSARWLSCQSKIRHRTQTDAQAATWTGAPYWYSCPLCRGWHTTATDDMHDGWRATVAAIAAAIGRVETEQGWVWLHPAAPDSRLEAA